METPDPPSSSHLFLIRLWPAGDAGPAQWAGKLQHVASGEAHDFAGWPALIDLLLAILPAPLPGGAAAPAVDGPAAHPASDGAADL
jgi:hypothetical protein